MAQLKLKKENKIMKILKLNLNVLIFLCTFSVTALADSPEQVGSPKQQSERDTGPLKMMSGDTTWYDVLKEAFEKAGTTNFTENYRDTLRWLAGNNDSTDENYGRPPEFVMRVFGKPVINRSYTSDTTGRCFSKIAPNYAQNSLVSGTINNKILGPGQNPVFKAIFFNSYDKPSNYYDKRSNFLEDPSNKDGYHFPWHIDNDTPMIALEEDGPYIQDFHRNVKSIFRTGATKLAPNDEYLLVEVADLESDNAVKKYCYYFYRTGMSAW